MDCIYLNMDRKLIKKGGRKAVKISKEELLKKLYNLYKKSEEYYDEDVTETNFDETYHLNTEIFIENKIIEKDLSKISFGYDNFIASREDISDKKAFVGFNTLENGLTFFGVIDSGDDEFSIFYIIYYDGKNLRGYTPSYGNLINLDFKTAFGGEYYNCDNYKEILKNKGYDDNEDFITQYAEKHGVVFSKDSMFDINWDAIIEDIESRIIVK